MLEFSLTCQSARSRYRSMRSTSAFETISRIRACWSRYRMYARAVRLCGEAMSTSSTMSWMPSTDGTSPGSACCARFSTRTISRWAVSSPNSPVASPALRMAVVIFSGAKGTMVPLRFLIETNTVVPSQVTDL